MSAPTLEKNGYIKVVATQIKGFPKELVVVDKDEFDGLADDVRNSLFELIDQA